MKIQTLSVVVPTKRCINNCKMCVSKMHDNDYVDSHNSPFYVEDLKRRINYAVINGVDTMILTGTGEALQNKGFLSFIDKILKELGNPIPRIELQTSGVLLNDKNLEFLRIMGVSTISLSVNNLFDDERNLDIMGCPPHAKFKLDDLCKRIRDFGFNIRLSLNMTKDYDSYLTMSSINKAFLSPYIFTKRANELKAKQITFRELYDSRDGSQESEWTSKNSFNKHLLETMQKNIRLKGTSEYVLPFGATVYSLDGVTTVVDNNCMSHRKMVSDAVKYLILREDGKLYTDWEGNSLVF